MGMNIPLLGSDSRCSHEWLRNEKLMGDFEIAVQRGGEYRILHLDEWFKVFGFDLPESDKSLKKPSCREVNKKYRKLMLEYHPDKKKAAAGEGRKGRDQAAEQECYSKLSLLLSAGRDILKLHCSKR